MAETTLRAIAYGNNRYVIINPETTTLTGTDATTDSNGDIKSSVHTINTFVVEAYVGTETGNYVVIPHVGIVGGNRMWFFRVLDRTTNEPVRNTALSNFTFRYHTYADLMD